ncbi:MAG: hypothetical protein QM760_21035 [Nibricoccus sp.]
MKLWNLVHGHCADELFGQIELDLARYRARFGGGAVLELDFEDKRIAVSFTFGGEFGARPDVRNLTASDRAVQWLQIDAFEDTSTNRSFRPVSRRALGSSSVIAQN